MTCQTNGLGICIKILYNIKQPRLKTANKAVIGEKNSKNTDLDT